MNNQHIEIKTDGAFSKVYVDGHEIKGIREFTVHQYAGQAPMLSLVMNTMNLTIDGKIALRSKDYPDEEMMFVPSERYKKISSFYQDHFADYPESQEETPE